MVPNLANPSLSFRFWCGAAKSYVEQYRFSGYVDELFEPDDMLFPQQCTGLTDAKGNWVYEGDLVQIPSDQLAGILPGADGDDLGRLEFEVERDPCEPCNLILVAKTEKGIEVHIPLARVKLGRLTKRGFTTRVDSTRES
jgi:hypothetical protein